MRDNTSLGFKHRNAYKLMTSANHKTPKGEASGYLSAILYLAPHTTGGGATLCPHSTNACRAMCLAGAGMSGLPLQLVAKFNRTRLYNSDRPRFLTSIRKDLEKLRKIAAAEGLKPVARLNGTSDVIWERVDPTLHDDFPDLRFVEYTKIPLEHRGVRPNLHLTYSYMGPQDAPRAMTYLRAGHSVAVVVPETVKARCMPFDDIESALWMGEAERFPFVDGDAHDLRFLDPRGAIVLLKPKGRLISSLLRPDFVAEFRRAAASVDA